MSQEYTALSQRIELAAFNVSLSAGPLSSSSR